MNRANRTDRKPAEQISPSYVRPPAAVAPVRRQSVIGALRALVGLLETESGAPEARPPERSWITRRTSGIEGRAWDRAVTKLRRTGAVVRPGRENMIVRAAFEEWVSKQRVVREDPEGQSEDEYETFADRARTRARRSPKRADL